MFLIYDIVNSMAILISYNDVLYLSFSNVIYLVLVEGQLCLTLNSDLHMSRVPVCIEQLDIQTYRHDHLLLSPFLFTYTNTRVYDHIHYSLFFYLQER